MPTYILGISAFYHDSAACLVRDGEIVAAAQEERFTRKKFDARFPGPCDSILPGSGRDLALKDLKYVVFYDKPLIKFERLLETYVAFSPKGIQSFLAAMPVWLKEKLFLKSLLQDELCPWTGFEQNRLYRRSFSASITNRTRRRRFILRRSSRPRCCAWMASANGRRLRPGWARAIA